MASFIHKIWLTPVQCKVLDFIKENADAVEYKKGKTVAILPGYNEYTVNHVFIHADNKALHATLIAPENKSQDFKSTYSFSCKKPCTNKKCPLLNATICSSRIDDGFAKMVYARMYNNYIEHQKNREK